MATKHERPRLEKARADLERLKAESDNDAPELLVDTTRAEVHLYGRIGPSKSGGVSGRKFAEGLKAMGGKDFTLFINSPGGEVGQGWSIGNQIDRYTGTVTGVVDGVAASIASYIICCCKVRLIAQASAIMVHNAWSSLAGDEAALKKEAALLQKFSASIHAKYVEVTGQTADQVQRWMDTESWFFSDEAITAGFCSGRYGQASDYRPRLAAAKRAGLRLRMQMLDDQERAICASFGQ